MSLPSILFIDGIEYRRVPDEPEKPKDPTEGHSPLPWTVSVSAEDGPIMVGGHWICGTRRGDDEQKNWPANRALILRAVNNHADLVAFVEKMIDHGENEQPCFDVSTEAQSLLAKVKGSP